MKCAAAASTTIVFKSVNFDERQGDGLAAILLYADESETPVVLSIFKSEKIG